MGSIHIPSDLSVIMSVSSKGDQSKWRVGEKWVKQNSRGYEDVSEYAVSMILKHSTLLPQEYVLYEPCEINFDNEVLSRGCYSLDFRGTYKQEVSLERLFEKHYGSTSDILGSSRLTTEDKISKIAEKVKQFTNLDIWLPLTRMLALDAFILNEDRHTNNILFLYDDQNNAWELAPLFDHGLSFLSDTQDYPLGVDVQILKRKVKAKPFNSSFKKQLALYEGPPFLKAEAFMNALQTAPFPLGRLIDVLKMQLEDPTYEKLLIRGE